MTATFKPEQMLSSWSLRTGPERLKFVLLPELFLDPALVKAARLGHRFACLHLGLEDPPTLGFYELQGVSEPSYRQKQYQPSAAMAFVGGDHAGHADRDSWSVGVRMDTHGGKSWLAEVAAHEVRHLAQSKDDEDDAKAYGRWAAGVLRRDHHGGLVNVYAWS